MKTWRDAVLIICAALVLSAVVGQASERVAEQPQYKPGDYWVFTKDPAANTEEGAGAAKPGDVRLEFVSQDKDGYVFLVNGVRTEKWDKYLSRKTGEASGYPGCVLEFPLKVGNYWKREYTSGSPNFSKPMIARYAVETYEEIAFPTGKFRVYKIEAQKAPVGRSSGKTSGTSTYWYSPEAKMIINAFGGFLKEYRVQ